MNRQCQREVTGWVHPALLRHAVKQAQLALVAMDHFDYLPPRTQERFCMPLVYAMPLPTPACG